MVLPLLCERTELLIQINGCSFNGNIIVLQTRQLQQLIKHAVQPVHLADDPANFFFVLRGFPLLANQYFQGAADGRQRGAYFVGGVGCKLFFALHSIVYTLQQFIDGGGQPINFVFVFRQGQTGINIGLADTGCRLN